MTLELDLSFTWFTFEEQLHSFSLISTCRVTAKTHTHVNTRQQDKSYRTQRHARKQTLIGGMWGFGKCRLDGHFVQRLLEFEFWFNSTPTFHFCGRYYRAAETGRVWNDLCCHLLDVSGTTRWRALAGGKKVNWDQIKGVLLVYKPRNLIFWRKKQVMLNSLTQCQGAGMWLLGCTLRFFSTLLCSCYSVLARLLIAQSKNRIYLK